MKTFYRLLIYSLIASTTNNFVWFAITYWIYLQTKSVLSTSLVGGFFLVATAVSGFWFGAMVDHLKKKTVMMRSSLVSLSAFIAGFIIYVATPESSFASITNPVLWILVVALMSGVVFGNIIAIAIPTLITHLIPQDKHDRANGLMGTVMGISFAITSVASGLVLGFFGMKWVLVVAIAFTFIAIIALSVIKVKEKEVISKDGDNKNKIDIKGTIAVIRKIPGLFALIFFATFNNFLGGVFMALMDAYGLSLVSVQVWGLLWGVLSFGFIFGGLYISKKGLGKNPLKTLFIVNAIIWVNCIIFPIQPSIILLFAGSLVWMSLMPFVEATEQTVIQKVVPPERQGRIFGFAQSVEQAASPLTAFLIGPIAQFVFIPFMTTGRGVDLIGSWFGTGIGRGIALVFMVAGVVGLVVALLAMKSRSYKLLSERYMDK